MSFNVRRSDYMEADTFFTDLPKSKKFIKAEKSYDFIFSEQLNANGEKTRTREKEAFFDETHL